MVIKVLSVKEIREIEEKTEKSYGISRLILMENAGRTLAESLNRISGGASGKNIIVFSGKGNNGGDGFVAARYLFNMGACVKVFYTGMVEKYSDNSFTNLQILFKMNIPSYSVDRTDIRSLNIEKDFFIVDALFGSGIKGAVYGKEAEIIEIINASGCFVACADVPSGLDPDTGEVSGLAVKGSSTVSFGFAKKGFYLNRGPEYCGSIEVADIGFPRFFYNGFSRRKW